MSNPNGEQAVATLFIDSNIFLSFFHLSKDTLDELKKLQRLIRKHEITLLVPEQVFDEVRRNRDAKVAEALHMLKSASFTNQFPVLCRDFEAYDRLRKLLGEVESEHRALIKETHDLASRRELLADALLDEIFKVATHIPIAEDPFAKAERRAKLGNPPGKPGSLGDALNWECLLSQAPRGDLYLVSDDKDFRSSLDEEFSPFLASEWAESKHGQVFFYRRLSDYTAANHPNIRIDDLDEARETLIEFFCNSGNFAATHFFLPHLASTAPFTPEEAKTIIHACTTNDQISMIIGDADVHRFVNSIIQEHKSSLDTSDLESIDVLLNPTLGLQNANQGRSDQK